MCFVVHIWMVYQATSIQKNPCNWGANFKGESAKARFTSIGHDLIHGLHGENSHLEVQLKTKSATKKTDLFPMNWRQSVPFVPFASPLLVFAGIVRDKIWRMLDGLKNTQRVFLLLWRDSWQTSTSQAKAPTMWSLSTGRRVSCNELLVAASSSHLDSASGRCVAVHIQPVSCSSPHMDWRILRNSSSIFLRTIQSKYILTLVCPEIIQWCFFEVQFQNYFWDFWDFVRVFLGSKHWQVLTVRGWQGHGKDPMPQEHHALHDHHLRLVVVLRHCPWPGKMIGPQVRCTYWTVQIVLVYVEIY